MQVFFNKLFKKKFFYIYSIPTIIENEIFWNGLGTTWLPLSIRIWSKIVKKKLYLIFRKFTIYSLVSCAFNKKLSVYAFEPNTECINAIKSKIKK